MADAPIAAHRYMPSRCHAADRRGRAAGRRWPRAWLIGFGCVVLRGLAVGTPAAWGQPLVTFLGVANPAGVLLQQSSPGVYQLPGATGVTLIVEGGSGAGTQTFDASGLPDLQIEVTRALGDGSPAVCDPDGGVPAAVGPMFTDAAAINDLACRFDPDICPLDPFGEPRFFDVRSAVQLCAAVGPALALRDGETTVSVRLRGTNGMVGPAAQIRIQVGPTPATPTPTTTMGGGTPTPTSAAATATGTPSRSVTSSATATRTAPPATTTRTGSPTATATTPTRPATATATPPGPVLIDLGSLLHALFAPDPPPLADVNGDGGVSAADVTELLRLRMGG